MRIGEEIETAVWITGDESETMRKDGEERLKIVLAQAAAHEGYIISDVKFFEKRPEEDRVPEVPKHIQGSKVRLLVAEARIVAEMPKVGFTTNLDYDDLQKLRKITRKQYIALYGANISDADCDELIESLGPEVALESLH